MDENRIVMTGEEVKKTLERLAFEVIERHGDPGGLAIVGIQRRGVDIAGRLLRMLAERMGREPEFGTVDITLYRDDWTRLSDQPRLNKTEIPFEVDGAEVVLVDDVLFTGRTTRAALEAILDFGRPRRVELLVLIDKGHRELPIQADYVGKRMDIMPGGHVYIDMEERDGRDLVYLG
jgi:pyrimidine operon attenuation protein/uracil phosphoribosyltransferase